MTSEPILVVEGYRAFNIIYCTQYYGILQKDGAFDLNRVAAGAYTVVHRGDTLEEVKALIDGDSVGGRLSLTLGKVKQEFTRLIKSPPKKSPPIPRHFRLFTMDDNRPITPEEVLRCRKLAAGIEDIGSRSGSLLDETRWIAPDGQAVYGGLERVDFAGTLPGPACAQANRLERP